MVRHAVPAGGELGGWAAARVLLRLLGVVALPPAQGAVVHGQGPVGVSPCLTDGSDRLDYLMMTPLWLRSALTAPLPEFARVAAEAPRPRRPRRRR